MGCCDHCGRRRKCVVTALWTRRKNWWSSLWVGRDAVDRTTGKDAKLLRGGFLTRENNPAWIPLTYAVIIGEVW